MGDCDMDWATPCREAEIAHDMTQVFSVDAMLHVMSEVGQYRKNIFRHCSSLRMQQFLSKPVV
jgi:hypothetical protein